MAGFENRNLVLDFYRGIAVILVIILHAGATHSKSLEGWTVDVLQYFSNLQSGIRSYSYYLLHIIIMWPSAYLIELWVPSISSTTFFMINLSIIITLTVYLSEYSHRLDSFFIKSRRRN